ncbi:MAG: hypothetical protein OXI59_11025 [Gemmatimonadota bacterium]|nr:hypothetical protein [Gemmatimonadota bacterium]
MMYIRRFFYGLVAVVLVTPAKPQTVSPYDYDVPVSDASFLGIGGRFSYQGSGSDIHSNLGRISLAYNRFYHSLPFEWDLEFKGAGSIRRTGEDKQKGSYSFEFHPGIRRYFNPLGNVFYSGELSIERYGNYDRPRIVVTPGLGYGRFIHVTPLARAVRIEEFLLEEGLIEGPLSKKTLLALAQVIDREGEYRTTYGPRYRVRWFEAMEKVIDESGKFVHGGLGGVGVLRIYEVLYHERVNQRFIGWWVRTGVEYQALTPSDQNPRRDPAMSLRLRYSRPIGWKSQFGIDAEYTSPVTGDFGYDVFQAEVSLNYLYEVTNRIDYTLASTTIFDRRDPRFEIDFEESVRSGFLFYIENQILINIGANFVKRRGSETSHGLNMSIEYRLR